MKSCCFSNHSIEGLRIALRAIYNVFVWYEVIVLSLGADVIDISKSEDAWVNKIPVWVAALSLWLFGMIERCCFNGTRIEVLLFAPYFYIHLILFSVPVENYYYKIVINVLLNLGFLHTLRLYFKYGETNMSNMNTFGRYNVGFKRIKSNHGNDCLAFYPVNKQSNKPV